MNTDVRADRILREVWKGDDVEQINYVEVDLDGSGQSCDTHFHQTFTETFVCLSGRVKLAVKAHGDEFFRLIELGKGESFAVLPDMEHNLFAIPGTTYLELRSAVYDPANVDKTFVGVK